MATSDDGATEHDQRLHAPARQEAAQPSPRTRRSLRERVGRFMFDLQADDYAADDAMRELAWADGRIRDFWLAQAGAIVDFLGLEACA